MHICTICRHLIKNLYMSKLHVRLKHPKEYDSVTNYQDFLLKQDISILGLSDDMG